MKRQLANQLGGIHMQQRPGGMGQCANFSHRHQHTGFVVGSHQRHQRYIRPRQSGGCSYIERTIAPHRDQVHLDTRLRQSTGQPQVAGVLNTAEYHPLTLWRARRKQAAHRKVIGLGGTTGKNYIHRFATQHPSHCSSRLA